MLTIHSNNKNKKAASIDGNTNLHSVHSAEVIHHHIIMCRAHRKLWLGDIIQNLIPSNNLEGSLSVAGVKAMDRTEAFENVFFSIKCPLRKRSHMAPS